jgi:prepilin peptidase CpaA
VKLISIKLVCLVCLLSLATYKDLTSYKIKNQLIYLGLFLGILFCTYENGWTGILLGISGAIVPIIILFPLFLFKVLGAGDIKLFSIVGCFYGVTYVIHLIWIAFIIAAVISVIHLIKHKNMFFRLQVLVNYIQTISKNKVSSRVGKKIVPYYDIKKDGYEGVIQFSPAILLAVLTVTFILN